MIKTTFCTRKPPADPTGSLHPTLKISGQTIENDGGINRQGRGRDLIRPGNNKPTTKLPPHKLKPSSQGQTNATHHPSIQS
jgi:hypothetical protein